MRGKPQISQQEVFGQWEVVRGRERLWKVDIVYFLFDNYVTSLVLFRATLQLSVTAHFLCQHMAFAMKEHSNLVWCWRFEFSLKLQQRANTRNASFPKSATAVYFPLSTFS